MFRRILIANRGEIAVRILRACRSLGVEAVAVYSDADAQAMHVLLADEAVRLGPAPSDQSYLDQDKIIAAAKQTGAQAIHPGYGFLSENAAFARRVRDEGLVFIGPSPDAMERMGDKVAARAEAEAAGVPVAPGSPALRDVEHARKEAKRLGLPVMLKASAGGGGIGMRVVQAMDELAPQFAACQAQARSAFGVPDVFMERFIERPRHIEVQVLADHHGNVVHLFERECSIQRRHQKLIEEAPSPALSEAQRQEIGQKVVELARRVGYTNAGTMEFLYEDGRFHFNEMNTRLQVEHPVTEMVTGIDIVAWQLRIAAGEPLDFTQDDVRLDGHAIELRINAEDPAQDFHPSPGRVDALRLPTVAALRNETALYAGWEVPSHYDSLVLKLVAHGHDREAAVARLQRALTELRIDGFATNAAFHQRLLAEPDFQAARLTTRFLQEHDLSPPRRPALAAALVAALHAARGGGLADVQLEQRTPPRIPHMRRREREA